VKDEEPGQFSKPWRLEPGLDQSKYFKIWAGKSSQKYVIPLGVFRRHPGFLTICGNPNHAHVWPKKCGAKTKPAFCQLLRDCT